MFSSKELEESQEQFEHHSKIDVPHAKVVIDMEKQLYLNVKRGQREQSLIMYLWYCEL